MIDVVIKGNGGGNYLIGKLSGNVRQHPMAALSGHQRERGVSATWNQQALLDVSTGGGSLVPGGMAASQSVYIQNDLEVDGTAYLAEAAIGSLTITSGLSLQGGSTFDHIEITGQAVFNTTGRECRDRDNDDGRVSRNTTGGDWRQCRYRHDYSGGGLVVTERQCRYRAHGCRRRYWMCRRVGKSAVPGGCSIAECVYPK